MDHPPVRLWAGSFWQITRFGLVGLGNTLIDIASLNMLLWCFPTHDANLLLLYNALAYSLGAVNSFLLNKYWTFRTGRVIAGREMLRFVVVMIGSFLCNESLLWIAGTMLHALIPNPWLWANLSKVSAAIGTTRFPILPCAAGSLLPLLKKRAKHQAIWEALPASGQRTREMKTGPPKKKRAFAHVITLP